MKNTESRAGAVAAINTARELVVKARQAETDDPLGSVMKARDYVIGVSDTIASLEAESDAAEVAKGGMDFYISGDEVCDLGDIPENAKLALLDGIAFNLERIYSRIKK